MTYAGDVLPDQLFLCNGALWRRLRQNEVEEEVDEREWSWLWFRLLSFTDLGGWKSPDHTYPHYMKSWTEGELLDMAVPYDGRDR